MLNTIVRMGKIEFNDEITNFFNDNSSAIVKEP